MSDDPSFHSSSKNYSFICEAICESWPVSKWAHLPILVAVSGGADSVALLRCLHQIALMHQSTDKLHCVHINHNTRPDENASESKFVADLAGELNISFRQQTLSPVDNTSEDSLRRLRYAALEEIAKRVGARYIATGHHQNDQLETVLFRIFRGTGIEGLQGIPKVRHLGNGISLVRPLLSLDRQTILDALSELGQDYCEDPTNSGTSYSRNFIRNEVIPLIETQFASKLAPSIRRLSSQASELTQLLDTFAKPLDDLCSVAENDIEIELGTLDEVPMPIVTHWLKTIWKRQGYPLQGMSYDHWLGLAELVCSEDTKPVLNLPGRIRAERGEEAISIRRTG